MRTDKRSSAGMCLPASLVTRTLGPSPEENRGTEEGLSLQQIDVTVCRDTKRLRIEFDSFSPRPEKFVYRGDHHRRHHHADRPSIS